MINVVIYGTALCPYCIRAEGLLKAKKVTNLQKIMVDTNSEALALMINKSGRRSVPQIFIGDLHVGGFDDLTTLDKQGKLDVLLS